MLRLVACALALVVAAEAGAGPRKARRKACAAQCGAAVTACVAVGQRLGKCRRRVLKECRRRGQDVVCTTTATSISTTTSSTSSTTVTTTSTTSTTHGFEVLLNTTWYFDYVIDGLAFSDRMYFARVTLGADGRTPILLGRDVTNDADFIVTQPTSAGLRYLLVEPVTAVTCFVYRFGLFPSGLLQGQTFTLDGSCLTVLDGPFPFTGTPHP